LAGPLITSQINFSINFILAGFPQVWFLSIYNDIMLTLLWMDAKRMVNF